MARYTYVLVFVMSAVALSAIAAAEDGSRPNVLLIIGDDQGWTDFGFMGHPIIQSPHLDALARGGVLFTHGYVPSSLCRPSLATLATGLYPHQHGITGNDPTARGERAAYLSLNRDWIDLFEESPNIAEMLGDAGYVSHQSGKWWEGACRCGDFTAGMTHGDPERGGRHGDEGLIIGRETMAPVFDFIDGAVEKDTPFFVWYAPFLPHLPHNPPERLLAKYRMPDRPEEVAAYYAMCEWLDETVGQLIAHLETRDVRDNTLIVFLNDNGWVQPIKDGPGWHTPYGAPKGKRSPYDGGLRTPVILNWPGHIAPDKIATPVSSIDIVPTTLAACGVKPESPLPGIDLRDTDAIANRDAIFGAVFAHDAADIRRPATSLEHRWTVAWPWKLIAPADNSFGTKELYNLELDPYETRDMANVLPDRVDNLLERLDAWWNPNSPQSPQRTQSF